MAYDKELIAGKLRRWGKYLSKFRLPEWESIPDIGLYMEQTVVLLRQYIDYLPPELKDGQVITATAINNYIRLKLLPPPVKKRYYRVHIAYLIIICTLKQNLSLSMLPKIIPTGISEEEVRKVYTAFARRHAMAADPMPTPSPTPCFRPTSPASAGSGPDDPYNAADFTGPEDFYEENRDAFDNIDDAEAYWQENS